MSNRTVMYRGLEIEGDFDAETSSFDVARMYAIEEHIGSDGARYRTNFAELPDWVEELVMAKHEEDIAQAAGECGDD